MFKKNWNKISNIGLQDALHFSAEKRIKLTNQLVSYAIGFTLLYTCIFVYWSLPKVVYIELVLIAMYVIVFIIAYYQRHLLARFTFISCIYAHIFLLCLCFGEASQMQLLLIPAAAVPLVLIEPKQIKLLSLLLIMAVATFSLLYIIDFSSGLLIKIPYQTLATLRISINVTAVLGEVIIIFTFIRTFEKTEQKLDESNLIMQEQLQAVFDNSFDALFLVDWKIRKIIKANRRAVELFQMNSEEDFYNLYGLDLHKEMPSESEQKRIRDSLNNNGFFEGEVLYKTKKGKEFWGALAIKLVSIGNEKYQSVRVTDITFDKKHKENVEASLSEKEILLSEIHHRVKNNMAVISGLLELQSGYIEDEHSRSLFEESRNRIQSMALIHDKLYHHETFARIDFNAYCQDLINFIKSSYNNSTSQIEFTLTCTDVFIDIKNAVPCGLILNELISNAYKHAFKDRDHGEIKIVCTKMGGKFTMMVSDNGIGFEAASIIEKPVSLGLTLISALVQQVNGNIKVVNKNGTTYYISFEE